MIFTPEALQAAGLSTAGLKFCSDFPPYDPNLVEVARKLRNDSTKAEVYLWTVLKKLSKQYKFIRQKPILHYIADFYCHELSLVVEIDGNTHNGSIRQMHDRQRDEDMQAIGLKVVRLEDRLVRGNPYGAAQQIFVSIGLPVPEVIDFFATGEERLFPYGYRRREV